MTVEPILITSHGGTGESKSRPIKIVMRTKEDKGNVMKNLGRLKGTERFFRKVSIKDDYTTLEREEIRLLTERAKKQRTDNPEKVFKVRGNSKRVESDVISKELGETMHSVEVTNDNNTAVHEGISYIQESNLVIRAILK